jgi:hypothetical protein
MPTNNSKASKVKVSKGGGVAPAEQLFQPKCKNCSGFEEKLSITEETVVKDEVSLMQKHEIIRQMSSFLEADSNCLARAEEMFEKLKYSIAEYVVKHEFNCENKLSVQMVLWLEQKCEPAAMNPLHGIIGQYLSKRA